MTEDRPLSIYLHIPFCVRKCLYCDFLSFPMGRQADTKARLCPTAGGGTGTSSCAREYDRYFQALERELCAAADHEMTSQQHLVRTVYFGGGTPSLPDASYITHLLEVLREKFHVADDAEITLEMNPGTVTPEKLVQYRSAGINRLSIGCQSLQDEELMRLGRIHTAKEFRQCYLWAREAGFDNISVDLMCAIPGQTRESLGASLRELCELRPEHLSVYDLIIEEGTPFAEHVAELNLPGEEEELVLDALTRDILNQAGYHRYEISNYALPGRESRHNSCYWVRGEYLGLGIGAASQMGQERWTNTRDRSRYESGSETEEQEAFLEDIREDRQMLSVREEMEETMFLGLRLVQGVDKRYFEQRFGVKLESVYGDVIRRNKALGLIAEAGDRIFLTERGLDVSNPVMSEFLLD